MAYLYRHIRLDKNEPFYIGICKNDHVDRSRQTGKRRNNLWHKIVAKTDYEIEIVLDNISHEFAKQKEQEFIKLYGRIVDGTGILANLTLGGDGAKGFIFTAEQKKKLGVWHKGKKLSTAHIAKLKLSHATRWINTPEEGKKSFYRRIGAQKKNKSFNKKVSEKWKTTRLGELNPGFRGYILVYKNGDLIGRYAGIYECARQLNIGINIVSKMIAGLTKTSRSGLIFKREPLCQE